MLVNTAVLGPMEVAGEQIFSMPEGPYGFDLGGEFALVKQEDEDVTLMWFQSANGELPCFVVFNPFDIIDGYDPVIEGPDLKALGCREDDKLEFLVIAVIPDDITKITVNLKSPIVLNSRTKIARQVILSNKNYPINFSLVEEQSAVNN